MLVYEMLMPLNSHYISTKFLSQSLHTSEGPGLTQEHGKTQKTSGGVGVRILEKIPFLMEDEQ